MSTFQYILSIALGQGIILAFFLLTSKYYKSVANAWLAVSLILLSILGITDIIGSEYTPDSIVLEFFLNDLELGFLVYVPLYYFFKRSISSGESKLNVYLFLPFIIDTMINLAIVCYYPIQTIATHTGVQLFYEIETILAIVFNLFMSYKSYQLIQNKANDAKQKNWINKIWQSTFILLLAWIQMTLGGFMMSSSLAIFILTLYILIAIWMFWLIYNGIVNLKLIADRKSISLKLQDHTIQQPAEILDTVEEVTLEKVSDHGILHHSNHKTLANHFERINTLVLSESLYRNEDLSIDDIAKRMDMSPGYVSKIIKKTANKNFPIWINEFRVEEVKAMFLDKDFDHYTTLSIGLEAGFKSKSAFYAAFKKITGETPAKFRRKKS